jgi:signal transduction histidine kinase/CheY-like chemotaxis protein
LQVLGDIIVRHRPGYVLLAVTVCLLAGVATIWLDERKQQERGALGAVWLLFRSMAAGSGIWAANIIVLLAYRPPYPVGLEPGAAALALGAAVLVGIPAMAVRRGVQAPAARWIAALVATLAFSAVHFAVLAGWRAEGRVHWALAWQAAGVLAMAVCVGLAWAVEDPAAPPHRRLTRVVLVLLGVAGLHLLSLAGVTVTPDAAVHHIPTLPPATLALGSASAWLALVALASSMALFQTVAEQKAFDQLRVATNAMPTAMAYFDAEDRLLVWNATFEQVMGAARPHVRPGMPLSQMIAAMPLADQRFPPRPDGRAPRERMTVEFEVPGGPWVRVDNVPTDDGGLLSLGMDITAIKRSEADLAEALARAEAASRAKSEFLATMSHEIRTPLNGVLGMAQALGRSRLSKPDREKLQVIQTSGEVLLSLLNDLLDLSKIEAGRVELEDGVVDIDEIASQVSAAFAGLAAEKDVSLALDVAPSAGRCWRGDPVRVRQILQNLVANAVKFTERGAVHVEIGHDGEQLILRVADTGPGIAPQHLSRVFEKFAQADASTTRRYGGSGLGLSICRELARLMGGDILVDSIFGEGATFTVRLPLAPAERPAAAPRPVQREAAPFAPSGLKILAAEDNPMNRLVLKTLLGQLGLEPELVEDGEQAVRAWEGGDWDLILMDVQMPVMDGPAATRLIRERELQTRRPRTPILALTANAMAHQAEEYRLAGMDALVSKPINLTELVGALSAIVDRQAREAVPARGRPRRAGA